MDDPEAIIGCVNCSPRLWPVCPGCRKGTIVEEAKFCSYCGTELIHIYCPNCAHPLAANDHDDNPGKYKGDNYCEMCGTRVYEHIMEQLKK